MPLSNRVLRTLAEIGALQSLAPDRRQALWSVMDSFLQEDLFYPSHSSSSSHAPIFPAMNPAEELQADYEGMKLSVARHSMELLRPQLGGVLRAAPGNGQGVCLSQPRG